MTHRANCAPFFDAIFGAGSATLDTTKTDTNNVIGALASPNGIAEFKGNFEERLRRINAVIKADPSLRKEVLGAVNRVAEDEWDGAYAELKHLHAQILRGRALAINAEARSRCCSIDDARTLPLIERGARASLSRQLFELRRVNRQPRKGRPMFGILEPATSG